jgi:hypothetical protein
MGNLDMRVYIGNLDMDSLDTGNLDMRVYTCR